MAETAAISPTRSKTKAEAAMVATASLATPHGTAAMSAPRACSLLPQEPSRMTGRASTRPCCLLQRAGVFAAVVLAKAGCDVAARGSERHGGGPAWLGAGTSH